MGVHIMPKVRARFTSNPPTGEEAQAALRGYTAYFGSFAVNDKEREKFVVHHRFGQINPGGAVDVKRFYDFVTMPNGSQRLILTPAPADGGGKDKATRRLVWQRMLDAPLTPEQKKFIGFWRLLYTDSYRTKDGKEVFHGNKVETRAGTSYIIYTPSGHMMVHLMNKEGRTKYAGAQPTPAESLAAYRSYNGYFGRFVTYENQNPPFVYHSQQGSTNPGGVQRAEALLPVHGERAEARRSAEPERPGRAGGRAPVLGAPARDQVVRGVGPSRDASVRRAGSRGSVHAQAVWKY